MVQGDRRRIVEGVNRRRIVCARSQPLTGAAISDAQQQLGSTACELLGEKAKRKDVATLGTNDGISKRLSLSVCVCMCVSVCLPEV